MTIQLPIPDYAAARQAMVDSQLRPQGVNDTAVIAAMGTVPRERFVPQEARPTAYLDRSIPLGGSRAMPSPEAVGLLLTALAPKPGERALVVGAGTGYSAAVLAEMGVDVVALEADSGLAEAARHAGIDVVAAPLEDGHANGAPYDLILVDGAVEHLPEGLTDQLREGGRIGFARLDRGVSRLALGRKAANAVGVQSLVDVGVPPLPGFARPRAFSF